MTPHDDDLLTALRAARPTAGYDPSASSPEATAMLTRILTAPEAPADRVTRRRLLLAGIPAAAGVAAAAVLATTLASGGSTPATPTTASVRTAVLDAFARDSGDIFYTTTTITRARGPAMTQRSWVYPAFPAAGQLVRYRLFTLPDGVPSEDTESIYVQDAAATHLSMPAADGPRSAETIDVEYATKTWSRQRTTSVLLGGGLGPAQVRQQIASRRFTVVGQGYVQGRQAIELSWSQSPTSGRAAMSFTTTMWVDAHSYVPLRSVSTLQLRLQDRDVVLATTTTQCQILPATPANLALLSPPIPAGFTRTPTSPHF
jgi:hypothetical protein